MRRNWLITGLMILLGGVLLARLAVQFGFPAFLNAQVPPPSAGGIIGTHAGFFDPGGNIKIANLVKEKGGGKNLMITVMFDLNATTEEMNSIIGSTVGLTPIVRIVGINSASTQDTSKATALAERLKSVNLPPGTLVVLGNELNNLKTEWLNIDQGLAAGGRQYGTFYKAFKDASAGASYTPVPGPLDVYNSDYDWKVFFDGAQQTGSAFSGDLVANAYDLSEIGGGGIDKYKEYEQRGGGKVRAFTEYGPHPSKSLQEHLNFYKSHPPSLPATTLVQDKCKTNDLSVTLWLYFIDGKIYDQEGNQVDPATCDKTTAHSGLPPAGEYYKRFIYPFYSTKSSINDIKKKLADDYTVTCSNPANHGTQIAGKVQDLIDIQHAKCSTTACLFSPEAIFGVDSTGKDKLFGVMRNESEVKWRAYEYSKATDDSKREFTNRFESVEQWFGANNPSLHSPGGPGEYLNKSPEEINGLHQGPFYKLTPLLGQCLAEGEVLKASHDLCAEWSSLPENNGQACGLTERKVAGTGKTYGQLYNEVGDYTSLCNAVFDPPQTTPPTQPPANLVSLANDLSRVDLYQETAYRPAFLVLTTKVDDEKNTISPSNPSPKFTTKSRGGSSGQHIVDFLVYHVPDTITDLKEETPGAVDDIVTRTAKIFTTKDSTEKFFQDYQSSRTGISEALFPPVRPGTIDCRGGVCDETLRRALIEFINAYIAANPDGEAIMECKDAINEPAESGSRIGSELAPNDTADAAKQSMKLGGDIDKAKVEVKIDEYVKGNNEVVSPKEGDNVPQTKIFNIAPYGARTQYVAEAFDALFTQAQQGGQFKSDDKYLTTFEAIFGDALNSDPDIAGGTILKRDPATNEQLFDEQGNPLYEQFDVRDEMKLNGNPPFTAKVPWLAKVFNYSTRAIVQQISTVGDNLLECARAVTDPKKNTEDFLLHCQSRGNTVGSSNPSSTSTDLGPPALGFDQFQIQYWSGKFTNFNPPPQLLFDAVNLAAQKHGCDPMLLVAVANSESQSYTNSQNPNVATARGVWQFTKGNWENNVWDLDYFIGSSATHNFSLQDGSHFDCRNQLAEDTCSPTNVYAAADAACRFVNAIGLSDQYNSHANFTQAFSQPRNPFNRAPYADVGRVWNAYPPQGEYVWRLWHALKTKDYETYKNQDTLLSNRVTVGGNAPTQNSTLPGVTNAVPAVTSAPGSPVGACTGGVCMTQSSCLLGGGTFSANAAENSKCGGGSNTCCVGAQ
ncbi:MAG: hypothetical protein ABI425_03055 [Patescibacteria group bacterium]